VSTIPFYFVLLEQYYTNVMYFPIINAVDDGVFFYLWLAISAGLYGSDWWTEKHEFYGFSGTKSEIAVYFLSKAVLI